MQAPDFQQDFDFMMRCKLAVWVAGCCLFVAGLAAEAEVYPISEDGFWISPQKVTFAQAAEVVASYEGHFADLTDENFLMVGSYVFSTLGPDSSVWIHSWNGNTYDGAPLEFVLDHDGWGSITTGSPEPRHAIQSPVVRSPGRQWTASGDQGGAMQFRHEGAGDVVILRGGIADHMREGGGPQEMAGRALEEGGHGANLVAGTGHFRVGGESRGHGEKLEPILPRLKPLARIAGGDVNGLQGVAVHHAHGKDGLDAERLGPFHCGGLVGNDRLGIDHRVGRPGINPLLAELRHKEIFQMHPRLCPVGKHGHRHGLFGSAEVIRLAPDIDRVPRPAALASGQEQAKQEKEKQDGEGRFHAGKFYKIGNARQSYFC